jgi:hypothetical protein
MATTAVAFLLLRGPGLSALFLLPGAAHSTARPA